MKFRVYAKLNLALNVLTTEQEGYHQLDMVNQSINLFDEIELAARDDKLCTVNCDKDIGVINTALSAAASFVKKFDCHGYKVAIKKGIPMQGGLGGSSADAAGILAALAKQHGLSLEDVFDIADFIGSDVKYMLTGGLARVLGKGEKVQTVETNALNYFVLIVPPFGMSTQRVFNAFDEQPDFRRCDCEKLIAAVAEENVVGMKMNMFNGLQSTALRLDARLKELFEVASEMGFAQMTGSGSCLFMPVEDLVEGSFLSNRLAKKGLNAVVVESRDYGVEYL